MTDQLENGIQTFDAAWQIIHDTHWDTNFNGVNWEGIRSELRPKAESARRIEDLRQVIEEMLGRLGQSHMALLPGEVADAFDSKPEKEPGATSSKPGAKNKASASPRNLGASHSKTNLAGHSATNRDGDVGLDVRLLGGRIVVFRIEPEGAAERAGVQLGWIVQKVENESISQQLKKLPPGLNSRQTQLMAWRLAKAVLTGEPGSQVSIEFLDDKGATVTLDLRRQRQSGEPVKLGLLPTLYARFESERLTAPKDGKIGLIRFNYWMIPIASLFDKAIDEFRDADGIVIDLRGNLGGLGGMIMGLSGHFLKERASLGTMKLQGNSMSFFANPRLVNGAGQRVEPFSGPVAILIDAISLSAAEIFAGGMQDIGRARIFGDTSGGQALPAVWDRLPNGDVLYHAFADYETGSGIRLEGRGVVPDLALPLSREDLLAKRDTPLLAAIEWIAQKRDKAESQRGSGGGVRPRTSARKVALN